MTVFLTRLPLPASLFGDSTVDFSRQSWAFPIVAALVGAVGVVSGAVVMWGTGNEALAAVFAIAAMVVATGALHEDGLADCADGFWGGRTADARLTIMRDSAIGTYGVLALVGLLAARAVAVAQLLEGSATSTVWVSLIAAAAFGRTALLWHWVVLPSAQKSDERKGESLARRFGRPTIVQALIATAVLAAILAIAWSVGSHLGYLAAFAVGAITTAGATLVSRAKIGGCSGDTLGATALLAETAFLCALLAPTSAP